MSKKRTCETCKARYVCDFNEYGFETCSNYISEDVVEVVRCEDCRHYNTSGCSDGFGWCESMNNGTHDERYCSEGERKDNE